MLRNTQLTIYTPATAPQASLCEVTFSETVCEAISDSRIAQLILVSQETTELQEAWFPNYSKSCFMTTEKHSEANKFQDLQKDVFKLESLISRIDQIETKCQSMQLLKKQLEVEQDMRMNLEQKLLELQEKLKDNEHKYQETIGWVDELEDKLRQEQQQQRTYDRKLTELTKKLSTLEKECNQRCVQIAEKTGQCQHLEEGIGDLPNEDNSDVTSMTDLSSILGDRTMEEALYQAAANGDAYTVQVLISHGANVNKRQDDEHIFDDPTPLHAATISGHKSTVFALLKASANANARAYTSATPLICAARAGNVEVSELLLKFGANVNFRDSKNMTALHYACSHGFTTLARLLIRNGANLSARASNQTPAELAESNGHKRLARYIRSKMK